MGYAGKVEQKTKARKLRGQGSSIKKIERKLDVSRSSVSIWCRDIQLTDIQIKKLYASKKTGALKGSIIASTNKQRLRNEEIEKMRCEGIKQVGKRSKRDLYIAGISLYAAEGEKTDGVIGLSNSDARIIRLYLQWLRVFFSVPEEKFRASIYLHDNLSELAAKRYWSKITELPLSQFRKTYFVANKMKSFRNTKHKYGILRVRASDVKLHRKIMGLIDGLLLEN